MEEKEREKEKFFQELYELDEQDDYEEVNTAALILKESRKRVAETAVVVTPHARESATRRSSIEGSEHTHLTRIDSPICRDVDCVRDSPAALAAAPVDQRRQMPLKLPVKYPRRATDEGTVVAKEVIKMPAKRKREKPLQVVPVSRQIFRGLQFFFVPNNDIAPARRMRIAKALEYGASWVKSWREDISHIIVDKDIQYKDVLSFLKISSLPGNVTIVNELYPAECIIFRFLIDANQFHYQVEGYTEALAAKDSVASAAPSSVGSLALKADKGAFVKPPETPSRTEETLSDRPAPEELNISSEESCNHGMEGGAPEPSRERPKDALDQVIEEAKALAHLPLDSDEEDPTTKSMTRSDSDSELSDSGQKHRKARKGLGRRSWQDNFSCMQKHDGETKGENPNARTIEVLQQMATYYDQIKDHWRTTAYRKAIAALRKQPRKITTKDEAFAITFIGERLALKIEEIVWTNRLRRLDNTRLEPQDELLQKFLNIYGVGFSQASKWVSQGHQTLDDLLAKAHLTDNQKIGIVHYDDFLSRIPRAEVEAHGAIVRSAVQQIDKDIQVTVMGSYRRGATDTGDIDLIITKPDAPIHYVRAVLLDSVIPQLFAQGFLKASLASTSPATGTKWHGASALLGSSVRRRIDFLLVPWDELGAALIYFTGNDIFNRSIRLLASRKGMRLNQRGLWRDVIRGPNRERVTQGTLVEGRSERRIFEILGVPWRRPEHRIC